MVVVGKMRESSRRDVWNVVDPWQLSSYAFRLADNAGHGHGHWKTVEGNARNGMDVRWAVGKQTVRM
jgi:hypothetical protein